MSFKVTFRDRTSTYMNTRDGVALKDMLLSGTAPANIEINGDLHRSSEILSVVQEADPAETITEPSRRIESKRCQGKASIQWAITKIIMNKYKADWPKKVKDKTLREELRQALLATSKPFCDYKSGPCVCASYTGPQTAGDEFIGTWDEVKRLMSV